MPMLSRRTFLQVTAAAAACVAGGLSLGGCARSGDVLRVGTKIDVPAFGFQNPETGNVEGMEVDIARELAARLMGSADRLQVTGVNASTRGAMLDNGTLDAVMATFTITEDRKRSYNFSQPYYTDHIGILVKKDAGIEDFRALDGKTVGVAMAATTRDKLNEAAQKAGIVLSFAEYATYPELKIALVAGRVAAFSVDRSILAGYVDSTTMLLSDEFAPQEYGVATARSNTQLAERIDAAVGDMLADGTLLALQQRWGLAAQMVESEVGEQAQADGGGRAFVAGQAQAAWHKQAFAAAQLAESEVGDA